MYHVTCNNLTFFLKKSIYSVIHPVATGGAIWKVTQWTETWVIAGWGILDI